MTRDQLIEYRDAIDAHLAGKPIQWRTTYNDSQWRDDCSESRFSISGILLRPKPEQVRFWGVVYKDGSVSHCKDRFTAQERKDEGHERNIARIAEFLEIT